VQVKSSPRLSVRRGARTCSGSGSSLLRCGEPTVVVRALTLSPVSLLLVMVWQKGKGRTPRLLPPESWQIVGKWLFQRRFVKRKSRNHRINIGDLWWAWVDLNHGPRSYQGSVVRFYNDLQEPRGLPKYLQVAQDIANCGLDCGLEITCYEGLSYLILGRPFWSYSRYASMVFGPECLFGFPSE